MYNAPGSDSKAEWVELQNTGNNAVDISKWKLNDGSNHVFNTPPKNGSTGTLMMEPGEFLVLASNAPVFLSTYPDVLGSVIVTVMSLPNDSGKISLLDASGTVADEISYSSSEGANGTGESLQLLNGKFSPARPTPDEPNSSARIPKPVSVTVPSKTSSKKVATRLSPEILDGTSTVASEVADTGGASSSEMLAAAVVPLNASSNSYLPWAYGALALGIAGASAVLVTRQKKKGEWEIEEIV